MLKIGDKIEINVVIIAKKETGDGLYYQCCLPDKYNDKIHWNTITITEPDIIGLYKQCEYLDEKSGMIAGDESFNTCKLTNDLVNAERDCKNCEEKKC